MSLKLMPIILSILLISACSTTYSINSDYSDKYNFSSIKSYAVIGDGNINTPLISDLDKDRINSSITKNLNAKGKIGSDITEADVIVSYFIMTKDKVNVTSSLSSGYAHYGIYGSGANNISARQYTEGTLVIDLIDNNSNKVVWRSSLSRPLKQFDSVAEREQFINEIINSIFAEIPLA